MNTNAAIQALREAAQDPLEDQHWVLEELIKIAQLATEALRHKQQLMTR